MQKRIAIISIAAVVGILAGLILSYFLWFPRGQEGVKTVAVEIVLQDGKVNKHTLHTDALYLRQALEEKNLIAGEDSALGLYVLTVDGVTADSAKQEWWCLTKAGGTVMTGVDTTPIADGDTFELTLKTGYDD